MLGNCSIYATKVLTLLVLLHLYACKPEEAAYDVVPAIQLLSTQLVQTEAGTDSLILLTLSYTDGDGDLGLTDADTAAPFNFGSPFFHNLPVTYLVPNASGDYMELQSTRAYSGAHTAG
jgi:hypothetical protein